jgi:nicotinamidase-related amidase
MKHNTALLVIDAQKIYTHPASELYCPDCRGTIARINKIVKAFETKKLPIFFIRHVHKKNGSARDLGRMFDFSGEPPEDFNFKEGTAEVEYDERLYRPKNSTEIVKNRYSSFVGTGLNAKLKKAKVDTVVITGFMTNFCCESAARDAHDLDYFVDFVVDATGTPGTQTMNEKQVRAAVADFLGLGFARIRKAKEMV